MKQQEKAKSVQVNSKVKKTPNDNTSSAKAVLTSKSPSPSRKKGNNTQTTAQKKVKPNSKKETSKVVLKKEKKKVTPNPNKSSSLPQKETIHKAISKDSVKAAPQPNKPATKKPNTVTSSKVVPKNPTKEEKTTTVKTQTKLGGQPINKGKAMPIKPPSKAKSTKDQKDLTNSSEDKTDKKSTPPTKTKNKGIAKEEAKEDKKIKVNQASPKKKQKKDTQKTKPEEPIAAKEAKDTKRTSDAEKKGKPSANNEKATKLISKIKASSKASTEKKGRVKDELGDLSIEEDDDEFALVDDLVDGLAVEGDDFAVGLLESTPLKRKPGRPPKPKDLSQPIGTLPPSIIRLPKKQVNKPRKPLSDTLPGTSLAALFESLNGTSEASSTAKTSTQKSKSLKAEKKEVQSKSSEELLLNEGHEAFVGDLESPLSTDEAQTLPSWMPRDWVTREGERLIIRGNELVKEDQQKISNLPSEAAYGVISPDQVEDVIRKIRESYKKKNTPKKITG